MNRLVSIMCDCVLFLGFVRCSWQHLFELLILLIIVIIINHHYQTEWISWSASCRVFRLCDCAFFPGFVYSSWPHLFELVIIIIIIIIIKQWISWSVTWSFLGSMTALFIFSSWPHLLELVIVIIIIHHWRHHHHHHHHHREYIFIINWSHGQQLPSDPGWWTGWWSGGLTWLCCSWPHLFELVITIIDIIIMNTFSS